MAATDERRTEAGTSAGRDQGMPDVRLERVTKVFGDTVAVDDISLDIAHGEFFSLLGPSGCGKTTTLSMIGGFEDPTAGRILLHGDDVTLVPPYRRDVNTVFQSYALFPHLSVFDNVAFGLRRKGVARAEIRRRVGEMLELVALTGLDSRKPAQLSGGQQQRIALARALVNQPRVLLLDEPLGALDLKLRKQMQLELKRIQNEVGITFLYVTHDQEEAMVMSNRLAVMNGGHIEQVATPEEAYDRPATGFVAGFLGASNLLSGRIGERSDGFVRVDLDRGGSVLAAANDTPDDASLVQIGVRPEKLTLAGMRGEVPPRTNALDGRVALVTYIGVSHQYSVELAGGGELTVYAQNAGGAALPQGGDAVRVLWEPEHTFIVRKETS
ncbi:MAG TPA: ABC transporter ATP-binding protein [Gaiellaceae bacterium]|nr:ABC transporter ATP-binding protein [Gaiellaceae bacterium]